MIRMIKNKNGVTLIELIIVISLIAVVSAGAYSIFSFGNKVSLKGNNQFETQSDIRLAVDVVSQEIRFATEISIIPVATAESEIASGSSTFNYLFIKSGSVNKSIYDPNTSTRSNGLVPGSVSTSLSNFQKVSTDTIKVQLGSQVGDQVYTIDSDVKLENLNLVKPVVGLQGSNSDLAVKYKDAVYTSAPPPAVNTKTITFNSAGGTSVPSIVATPGTTIIPPANPTKTGYTFAGWSPGLPAEMPATNTLQTALWTLVVNTYTITFDSNGGTPVASITQAEGTSLSPPAPPTRTGYTFTGWSPALPGIMPSNNFTVVAQWTGATYTVTFNSNGGSTPSPSSKVVNFDSTYGTLPMVTRSGFIFNGWFTATSGGTRVDSNSVVNINSNQTLYAQWTASNLAINSPGTSVPKGTIYNYNANASGGTPPYVYNFVVVNNNDGGIVTITGNTLSWASPNGNNKTLIFNLTVTDSAGATRSTGNITVTTN